MMMKGSRLTRQRCDWNCSEVDSPMKFCARWQTVSNQYAVYKWMRDRC